MELTRVVGKAAAAPARLFGARPRLAVADRSVWQENRASSSWVLGVVEPVARKQRQATAHRITQGLRLDKTGG
jgi:hypothetical protein